MKTEDLKMTQDEILAIAEKAGYSTELHSINNSPWTKELHGGKQETARLLNFAHAILAAAPEQTAPSERQIPYAIALTAIERLRGCAATTIEDHEKDAYDYNSQVLPQHVAFAWAKEIHRIEAKAFLDEAIQDAAEQPKAEMRA